MVSNLIMTNIFICSVYYLNVVVYGLITCMFVRYGKAKKVTKMALGFI